MNHPKQESKANIDHTKFSYQGLFTSNVHCKLLNMKTYLYVQQRLFLCLVNSKVYALARYLRNSKEKYDSINNVTKTFMAFLHNNMC